MSQLHVYRDGYTQLVMLTEKQFRERTRMQLRHIANEIVGLIADRDLFRKLESEIVANNPQLSGVRNPVLEMLRGCYADSMSARALRLLINDGNLALAHVLERLAEYPQLLENKISEGEFLDDCAALRKAAGNLMDVSVPRTAHYERTMSALAPFQRELDSAIKLLMETVKTYYWIIADGYVDLAPKFDVDPLAVFQFSWAVPALAH